MATEPTRSWFQIRQQKPDKSSPTKKGQEGNVKNLGRPPMNDAPSNATKQKVAAAKQYIENHYKIQKKSLQERKERYVLGILLVMPIFTSCALVVTNGTSE
jgi:hypothetical protein